MYHNEPPCAPPRKCDDRFKIECVIVCCNYADFLACTLPNNKQLFDRIVVVTSPEDLDTQKLCEFYHVQCVQSARMVADGKFRKGAGINDGLAKLSCDGWVLHLDADIWLPPLTRILLQTANLDKKMVYGIDRFNVHGFEQWQRFLERPRLQQENGAYIHAGRSGLEMGTRVMQHHMSGYVPIGFFQLWHPQTSQIKQYPEGHTTAGREDILFSNKWDRGARGFIPEIISYHLESDDSHFGINWGGRKTSPFRMLHRKTLKEHLAAWFVWCQPWGKDR